MARHFYSWSIALLLLAGMLISTNSEYVDGMGIGAQDMSPENDVLGVVGPIEFQEPISTGISRDEASFFREVPRKLGRVSRGSVRSSPKHAFDSIPKYNRRLFGFASSRPLTAEEEEFFGY